MSIVSEIFVWLCLVTGAIGLFAAVLAGLGWLLHYTFKMLKTWHTLLLLVGIKIHGKNQRDQLFWQAVTEHINGNPFAAKTVADFANRCAPFDAETSI